MSNPTAYFQWVKLGDFKAGMETIRLVTNDPTFQSPVGAAKAKAYGGSYGARYAIDVNIGFVSNDEEERDFRGRVRTLLTDLNAAGVTGPGNEQFGPLVFVRDEDGAQWGTSQKDAVTLGEAVTAGSAFIQLSELPDGWEVHDWILISDPSDASNIKHEVVEIEQIGHEANHVKVTLSNAYDSGVSVRRADWHMPQAALIGGAEIPGENHNPRYAIDRVPLKFEGTTDIQNGGAITARYYIDPTGGNDSNTGLSQAQAWATKTPLLTATINAGDRVRFKRGETHAGTFTFGGSGGTATAPIVLEPYGTGVDPIIDGASGVNVGVSLSGLDYVTIQGIDFANCSSAVDITDMTGLVIQSCGIDNSTLDGISLSGVTSELITLTTIENGSASGIHYKTGSTNATGSITSCTIADNDLHGITAASGATVQGFTWSSNTINGNGNPGPSIGHGINLQATVYSCEISGNTIHDNGKSSVANSGDGIRVEVGSALLQIDIHGNTIYDNESEAIHATNAAGLNVIYDNWCYGNRLGGVHQERGQVAVFDNLVTVVDNADAGNAGIQVGDGTNAVTVLCGHNTVYNPNQSGAFSYSFTGNGVSTEATAVVNFKNNISVLADTNAKHVFIDEDSWSDWLISDDNMFQPTHATGYNVNATTGTISELTGLNSPDDTSSEDDPALGTTPPTTAAHFQITSSSPAYNAAGEKLSSITTTAGATTIAALSTGYFGGTRSATPSIGAHQPV